MGSQSQCTILLLSISAAAQQQLAVAVAVASGSGGSMKRNVSVGDDAMRGQWFDGKATQQQAMGHRIFSIIREMQQSMIPAFGPRPYRGAYDTGSYLTWHLLYYFLSPISCPLLEFAGLPPSLPLHSRCI
jgi:hypothetical protein